MELDKICNMLEKTIGEKRLKHSIGAMNTAAKLADKYNCDREKAKIAGLLHDCGKIKDNSILLKKADEFGIILDDVMKNNYQLIHGPLGAAIAKDCFNIIDNEIISSIYYHTTGKENMTLLEKIIYLADYIEPTRDFPGVKNMRQIAYIDLNQAILLSMNKTLQHVLDKGELIHMNTIKARNYLIINELSMKQSD